MTTGHKFLHLTNGGAGSGKTTQLKQDLAHLASTYQEQLYQRQQTLLVVSYTNVAVGEIRERMACEYGDQAWFKQVEFCTLHSLARSVLVHFKPEVASLYVRAKFANNKRLKLEDYSFVDVVFGHEEAYEAYSRKTLTHLEQLLMQADAVSADAATASVATPTLKTPHVPKTPKANTTTKSTSAKSKSRAALPATIYLNHDQVLSAFTYLLATNERMGYLVTSLFPVIFIDEAQDSNVRLGLELIALYQREFANAGVNPLCQIRLYGDPNQQIYDYKDTSADFERKVDFFVKFVGEQLRAHLATRSDCPTSPLKSNLLSHLLAQPNLDCHLRLLEVNQRSSSALQNFYFNCFSKLLPNYAHKPEASNTPDLKRKLPSGKVRVVKLDSDFNCQCCLEQQWEKLEPVVKEFKVKDWVVLYPHRHDVVASKASQLLQSVTARKSSTSTSLSTAASTSASLATVGTTSATLSAAQAHASQETVSCCRSAAQTRNLAQSRTEVKELFKVFMRGCEDGYERKAYLRALALYFEQVVFPLVEASADVFDQVLMDLVHQHSKQVQAAVGNGLLVDTFYQHYNDPELWQRLKSLAKYFSSEVDGGEEKAREEATKQAQKELTDQAQDELTELDRQLHQRILFEAKALNFKASTSKFKILRAHKRNFTLAAYWLYLLNKLIPIPLSNRMRREQAQCPRENLALSNISKLASYKPQVLRHLLRQHLPIKQLNPTTHSKTKSTSRVLVTNIHKVKGQEFDNVMVVIQRHDLEFKGKSAYAFFNSLCKHGVESAPTAQEETVEVKVAAETTPTVETNPTAHISTDFPSPDITESSAAFSSYQRDLNLLYVACTRARKNLLVVLVEPTGESAQPSAPSLYQKLLEASTTAKARKVATKLAKPAAKPGKPRATTQKATVKETKPASKPRKSRATAQKLLLK